MDTVKKIDVIDILQNSIRKIHTEKSDKSTIEHLYDIIDEINKLPSRTAYWLRDTDGAWKCSNCGHRFFNGAQLWKYHCSGCGFYMDPN